MVIWTYILNCWEIVLLQVKPACLSSCAKVLGNGSFKTTSAAQNKSCNMAQLHRQEGHMRDFPGLTGGIDRKVCFLLNSSLHEISGLVDISLTQANC